MKKKKILGISVKRTVFESNKAKLKALLKPHELKEVEDAIKKRIKNKDFEI